ncbi:MAG: M23 family metallopeptidase [Bdellovibrionota bacterium]
MRFTRIQKSMLLNAMALAFAFMQAWPTTAKADDWNLDSYHLSLYPTETAPIRLYGTDSQYLGTLSSESKITIVVTGAMVRASMVDGKPDIGRVLQASSYRDTNGNFALMLTSGGDLRTQEGRQLPRGSRFLVSVNDFLALTSRPPPPEPELQQQGPANSSIDDAIFATGENVDEFGEDDEHDHEAEETVETRVEQFDIEMTRIRGRPFPQEILSSPVCDCGPSCRFSSGYGPRRARRTTNGAMMSRNHRGLDIAAPMGTPVIAAADGCVSRIDRPASRKKGYGNTIYLAHGNGYETQYSHLTSFSEGLRAGSCFQRGEQIGVSGRTGNVTGPHLHFGLLINGERVNPRNRFAMSAKTDQATRVRCNALLNYPGLDDAMRTALGTNSGARASTRRSSASN